MILAALAFVVLAALGTTPLLAVALGARAGAAGRLTP
jgi:hypothetical protein